MARTKHAAVRKSKEQPKKKLQFGRSPHRRATPTGGASTSATPARAAGTGEGAAAGGEDLPVFVEFGHSGAWLAHFSVLPLSVSDLSGGLGSSEVREVTDFYSRGNVTRWTPEALLAIQEAAEFHLIELFEVANLCAIHARRVTITCNSHLFERPLRCDSQQRYQQIEWIGIFSAVNILTNG
ncbi:histone H3-like isoform X2 [Panicum miliaceum]|uniref:Histone H3-like isoform X2 n=1 Tax=Panicum miliaceum TaxID=4540 RepID=A0A3L6T355_PANMI|nr:histone H3-like isoform X2 [Panicum miliaceum]